MGSLVFRMKVLPSDTGIDLDALVKTVQSKLPSEMQVRSSRREPIAFGLEALLLDITAPDEEGMGDKLEKALGGIDSVGNVEMVGVSRLSTSVKIK
ncbi:MAG: elongation factor 1-beta [Thaumarchaeota archaeon]|nr:elongation factor 1-beta [Nitrososphaerota archaeon]